ncbi:uncharacterized protein [Choristoneura fumiferana]|uniref:uncharacterized protein n=1 Tax=Choristoneura fumiferana TaxID=7141 RepID=UPI003D159F80
MLLQYVFTMYLGLGTIYVVSCTKMHALIKLNEYTRDGYCVSYEKKEPNLQMTKHMSTLPRLSYPKSVENITQPPPTPDPLPRLNLVLYEFMFGPVQKDGGLEFVKIYSSSDNVMPYSKVYHYPSGNIMHAQLFRNQSGVHLIKAQFLHRDHCRLNVTSDLMQTAVDAFAIILDGGLEDIKALPRDYVLHSARTIAMMKIAREKLAAMWTVVLAGNKANTITIDVLEKYRPLFKHLNGKQIARLNLTDDRIVTYIGTHPELNRHQVGIVASKYMKLNPNWSQPKYLNIMNNLLCGVPMTYIRKISDHTFLQLAHQVFYHTRACDHLQKRFYLNMMTKTQALGKAYSWSARDVSRLGLLITEVEGQELAAINPEAMSGLTAQVMNEMPAHNLLHITEMQFRYIRQKPLNILARKLNDYHDKILADAAERFSFCTSLSTMLLFNLVQY